MKSIDEKKLYKKLEKFIRKYHFEGYDYTIYDMEEFIDEIINILIDRK